MTGELRTPLQSHLRLDPASANSDAAAFDRQRRDGVDRVRKFNCWLDLFAVPCSKVVVNIATVAILYSD
jgi:hypothetical protein